MFKGIAVQKAQLNGNQNLSLPIKDACDMAEFGLALGCQISEVSALISLAPKTRDSRKYLFFKLIVW